MANFIPAFHFVNPEDKLKPAWCREVKNYYYYTTGRVNLLKGKKLQQIEQYWSGNIDPLPFKRMFTSMRKKLQTIQVQNPDGSMSRAAADLDTVGLFDGEMLALLPAIMNSAISNLMKAPADAVCNAEDALAMKKRKEDIDFLKNKPAMEADLSQVASQLGIGDVDLGTTKHSATKYSFAPAGLNLSDPAQEEIFCKLFYSLEVQTAFEKALKQIYNVKKGDVIRFLLNRDQLKYGVHCIDTYNSAITGLPDMEYVHPSQMEVPESDLPTFDDNTIRVRHMNVTVEELFNLFGNEICDKENLERIINGSGSGYCECNKVGDSTTGAYRVDQKNFNTFKVELKKIQVKSVDWIGVKQRRPNSRHRTFTMNESECDSKIWLQNTYTFYWLMNTEHYFGIDRLDYAYREKGNEAYQGFSTVIYKSQDKSATELSISLNKDAIIAELKMRHALIMSRPQGMYIDLRFLRNALKGLKKENATVVIEDLIALVFEKNQFIGDTEGFDGKNDGQIKPFHEIPGGLRQDVKGYIEVIINKSETISSLVTGINKNLTGQTSEELVGLQELKINSGLNAIDYCNQGTRITMETLYNIWGSNIQASIEAGGKTKQGVINMIGLEDVDLLDALDEAPLHSITISVDIVQRFKEMQAFEQQLNFLKSKNAISTVDEYLLSAIQNPREKLQKLYIIEERFRKQEEIRQQQAFAQQQQIEQQRNQTSLQTTQMKGEQEMNKIYAQGDVQAKLKQLAHQLGLTEKQVQGIIDQRLQRERNDGQTEKGIRTIQAKKEADAQAAVV